MISRPRSGRPRKFNDRTRRCIFQLARRHPRWTYAALGANIPGTDTRMSRSTIRRLLRTYGLRKWKSKKRIPLSKETAQKRVAFCREWAGFTEWEKLIFSDECSVQRGSNSPVQFVFRFQNEAFLQDFVNLSYQRRDISQMIWGGIWIGGRSKLVIMQPDHEAPRNGYSSRSYTDALDSNGRHIRLI